MLTSVVVRETELRRRVTRVRRCLNSQMDGDELSCPCGRCASRDVRVRDGPREMVECTRKVDLERCVPCIETSPSSIHSCFYHIHARKSISTRTEEDGKGGVREWYTEKYNCTGASSHPFASVRPSLLRRHQAGLTGAVWQQT